LRAVSVDESVPEPVLEMVRTLKLVMQAAGWRFDGRGGLKRVAYPR
jgi:hypothetical protein